MIQVLTWIDPFAINATLSRQRDRFKGGGGVHNFVVMEGEKPHLILEKWGSLRAAINRARAEAGRGDVELIRAEFEALDPGEHVPWYKNDEVLIYVGLRCNPGDLLYWPPVQHNPLPGQVICIPPGWRSAINMGRQQRIHLVLTLRPRKAEDQE